MYGFSFQRCFCGIFFSFRKWVLPIDRNKILQKYHSSTFSELCFLIPYSQRIKYILRISRLFAFSRLRFVILEILYYVCFRGTCSSIHTFDLLFLILWYCANSLSCDRTLRHLISINQIVSLLLLFCKRKQVFCCNLL